MDAKFYDLPSMVDLLMLRESFSTFSPEEADPRYFPPLQVLEDENSVYVRALVPGMAPEDMELVLKGLVLAIGGKIPSPAGNKLRQERPCGNFQRKIRLPHAVAEDSVSAVLSQGLLTVSLPKLLQTTRRIPVEFAAGGEDA